MPGKVRLHQHHIKPSQVISVKIDAHVLFIKGHGGIARFSILHISIEIANSSTSKTGKFDS
jgi:hypothetical protein